MSPQIRIPHFSEEYSKLTDESLLNEFHHFQKQAQNAQETDALGLTRNTYPAIRDELIEIMLEISSRFEADVLSR